MYKNGTLFLLANDLQKKPEQSDEIKKFLESGIADIVSRDRDSLSKKRSFEAQLILREALLNASIETDKSTTDARSMLLAFYYGNQKQF